MRVPVATYRIQLHDQFTLHDARDIAPYLAALGVSDLYLSPIFEARRGSTHGYDVTDPTRVRASLGGEAALRALADDARRLSLGILLDIVPNHMAASVENPWWRDLLRHGRTSRYAHYFDVDWESGDRLLLPILNDDIDRLIERGDIVLDTDARALRYGSTELPLADGALPAGVTGPAAIRDVIQRQHYQLVHWRAAAERMSYRRFFDIADLVGVRVEDDAVFDATHALIRQLAENGSITGLRIDHIDGLRDPAAYLTRLRTSIRDPAGQPLYTVVEKILGHAEQLPAGWQCEGTTGYDFVNLATGLLIEPQGHARIEAFYRRVTGDARSFAELVREKKLLVMSRLFGGELRALTDGLCRVVPCDAADARVAIRELTASMSVYRTYISSRHVRAQDRERIENAVADALHHNAGAEDGIATLRRVLLMEARDVAALDWIMRWQQFTGPVMAKGFEDTALYCHNALLAANEVGSNPARPYMTIAELHAALGDRAAQQPRALNATATHDTKRGEDTRARIAVLSELPDEWGNHLRRWIREGDARKAELAEDEDSVVADADIDSLLYQTLLGAWPGAAHAEFTDRVQQYMMKAVREAKEYTSWRRPDEDYEQALADFVAALMSAVGRAGLPDEIASFANILAPHGALNSITQVLLKITAPGIPDIYQGTELWSFTLVDPDNRGPVDFAARQRVLDDVAALIDQPAPERVRPLLVSWADGRIKCFITAAALRCRARHAATCDRGSFQPLTPRGQRAEHIVAFARVTDADTIVIALPRWTAHLAAGSMTIEPDAWSDTTIALPPLTSGSWRNVLTGERFAPGDTPLRDLFATLPFAVLENTPANQRTEMSRQDAKIAKDSD